MPTWIRKTWDSLASITSPTGSVIIAASTSVMKTCLDLRPSWMVVMTIVSLEKASSRWYLCRPTTKRVTIWAPASKPRPRPTGIAARLSRQTTMHLPICLAWKSTTTTTLPQITVQTNSSNRSLGPLRNNSTHQPVPVSQAVRASLVARASRLCLMSTTSNNNISCSSSSSSSSSRTTRA